MDKQFFICHSSQDTDLAETLVEELAASGYKCWISSRNLHPGADHEKPVLAAVLESIAVILIYSESSNHSSDIRNTLDIASNKKIPIIPLKFSNSPVSNSIEYYTDCCQWIDCTAEQLNTPEISEFLMDFSKETSPEHHVNDQTGVKKWKWISAFLLLLLLASMFLLRNPSSSETDHLINIVAGGRNSWDCSYDVIHGGNGSFSVAGTWDWGYWSEMWIAHFNSSGELMYSWSDSISGESKPLILPTADGGCTTVYTSFSDVDDSGYDIKALRLGATGNILWETRDHIEHNEILESELSSLCWSTDSSMIASFSLRLSTGNQSSIDLIKIDASTGSSESFTVPGNMRSLCMTTANDGKILHIYTGSDTAQNSGDIITFDSNWNHDPISLNASFTRISSVKYNSKNSIIAAGISGNREILSVIKFSENYEVVWEKHFNHMRGSVGDITILNDDSIVLVGSITSCNNEENNGIILHMDNSGEVLWETVIDTGGDDHIASVATSRDGSLLVTGSTTLFGNTDAWFMTVSPDGKYNHSSTLGIDLVYEDWRNGFTEQSNWIIDSFEHSTSAIVQNALGGFSLTANNTLVTLKESIKNTPGLCISAEITVPAVTETTENNWVSIGTSEQKLSAIDQLEETDCELKWHYSGNQELSFFSGRVSPGQTITESVHFVQAESHIFAIENYSDSVFFLVNDSPLCTMPASNKPDSLHFFITGSVKDTPHNVDNIRIYLRRW